MVVLTVADTGEGMDAQQVEHCFDPFFTTKPKTKGTGLGLSTAYGVVTQAGGAIRVDSRKGEGTTFTIELPYAGAAEQPARPPADPHSDRRKHVLFADDEAGLSAIVQRLLLLEGFDVTICSGGEEALARFDPTVHDLVLTDYGMPDLTGVEVASAVRRRSPRTPVLLVTGWGSDLDAKAPPPGITAVISKPFRLAALVEAVRSALNGAGDRARPSG